jgi:hypothetical protein
MVKMVGQVVDQRLDQPQQVERLVLQEQVYQGKDFLEEVEERITGVIKRVVVEVVRVV